MMEVAHGVGEHGGHGIGRGLGDGSPCDAGSLEREESDLRGSVPVIPNRMVVFMASWVWRSRPSSARCNFAPTKARSSDVGWSLGGNGEWHQKVRRNRNARIASALQNLREVPGIFDLLPYPTFYPPTFFRPSSDLPPIFFRPSSDLLPTLFRPFS
jgi:hypothetical protein